MVKTIKTAREMYNECVKEERGVFPEEQIQEGMLGYSKELKGFIFARDFEKNKLRNYNPNNPDYFLLKKPLKIFGYYPGPEFHYYPISTKFGFGGYSSSAGNMADNSSNKPSIVTENIHLIKWLFGEDFPERIKEDFKQRLGANVFVVLPYDLKKADWENIRRYNCSDRLTFRLIDIFEDFDLMGHGHTLELLITPESFWKRSDGRNKK